jgi:hypothetical protein
MHFGTLMGAWARIHTSKDVDLDEFMETAEKLYDLAKRLSLSNVKAKPEVQIDHPALFEAPKGIVACQEGKLTLPELNVACLNTNDHGPRTLGRYWATDIIKIRKSTLRVKNFFTHDPVDPEGARFIAAGIASENYWNGVFEKTKQNYTWQFKDSIVLKNTNNQELTLVYNADFYFKDEKVLEFKCPNPKYDVKGIKDTYKDQLEVYYRCIGLPVYLVKVSYPSGMQTEEFLYEPDDKRWTEIQELLFEFDAKLRKANKGQLAMEGFIAKTDVPQ